MEDGYITIKKAAEMLDMTTRNIYKLAKKGAFALYKVGKRATRIKKSEIHEYMERCKV